MALPFFQAGEITIKIAEKSVIVLHQSAGIPFKTYHRVGESVQMIFDELQLQIEAFTEVTQKEYDEAVEKIREALPF